MSHIHCRGTEESRVPGAVQDPRRRVTSGSAHVVGTGDRSRGGSVSEKSSGAEGCAGPPARSAQRVPPQAQDPDPGRVGAGTHGYATEPESPASLLRSCHRTCGIRTRLRSFCRAIPQTDLPRRLRSALSLATKSKYDSLSSALRLLTISSRLQCPAGCTTVNVPNRDQRAILRKAPAPHDAVLPAIRIYVLAPIFIR